MKKLLVSLCIGLLMTVLFFWIFGGFQFKTEAALYKQLSNALFLTAVLMGGTGLMGFVASQGMFDVLRYALTRWFGNLFRARVESAKDGYYEFKEERKKDRRVMWFLVWSGAVFLVLAFVFTMLYSHVTG